MPAVAVVNDDDARAGYANHPLFQRLVRVEAALDAGLGIVDEIDALDLERDLALCLDGDQRAAIVAVDPVRMKSAVRKDLLQKQRRSPRS